MSTRVIARNSLWLGIEAFIDFGASLLTSIAIARVIGPEKLGYYVFIFWLTRMSVILGNVGIPAMACKYMAEYTGRNMPGVSKTLYHHALRIQVFLAASITAIGLLLVVFWGSPVYRLPSLLLVLSILPAMANTIPTMANISMERPDKNVWGSFVSSIVYGSAVVVSLIGGWGLTGVASGILFSRVLEFLVRFVPVRRLLQEVAAKPLPDSLRSKMFTFSAQSLVVMILGVVVWDRSEVLFLKSFCPDVRQIAFYSVAFSLSEQALTVVRIFGNSIATSIRAQYGRDEAGLQTMISSASRYIAIIAFPVYLGLAAIGGPVVRAAYGAAYVPAIPVLVITAILTIPKAFQTPIQVMLQTTERQGFLMRWSILSAGLNLLLDWILIPRYGAIGAAYGNGLAQSFAVVGFWVGAVRLLHLDLPYSKVFRAFLAAMIMAMIVCIPAVLLSPVPAVLVAVPAGIAIFWFLLRLLGTFSQEDRDRFGLLRGVIPRPFLATFDWVVSSLVAVPAQRPPIRGTI